MPGSFTMVRGPAFTGASWKARQARATMQQMAQDTGGHAFYNTNGLSHAVAEAISEGSNYYTLAYTPTNTKWNGAYRKIQIKLRQPNLTLTYRRGYFADNPEEHLKHSTSSAATSAGTSADKPPDSIRPAMMHGAPTPTQIIFKASVLPIGGPPEDKLAPGNSAVPNLKGPYRRYNVSYAASPHGALSWRFLRDRAGLGILGDLGSHALDLAQMLLGPIVRVTATSAILVPRRPVPAPGGTHFSVVAEGAELRAVENEDCLAFSVSTGVRRNSRNQGSSKSR